MRRIFYVVPMLSGLLPAASTQTLYGLVEMQDAHISQEIQVIGQAKVDDSILEKPIDVWGTLSANHTNFKQGIRVRGNEVSLRHTTVNGDVSISNYLKKPKVILEDTIVNGRVIFNSLVKGEVKKDSKSKVIKPIKNGEVNETA